MSISRFRTRGTFDVGGGTQDATVEIDRTTGIVSVRPLRRHRKYSLPLAAVAAFICSVTLRAEAREKLAAKKAKKKKS